MNCQACGLPLTTYDEHRVACKNGHVWTLPGHADKPPTVHQGVAAFVSQRPLKDDPARPWLLACLALLAADLVVSTLGLVL